jgi:hypothetical protein
MIRKDLHPASALEYSQPLNKRTRACSNRRRTDLHPLHLPLPPGKPGSELVFVITLQDIPWGQQWNTCNLSRSIKAVLFRIFPTTTSSIHNTNNNYIEQHNNQILIMQFSTTAIIAFLAASAHAWELTVTMADSRKVTTHGTKNSGCITYDFDSKPILLPSPLPCVPFSRPSILPVIHFTCVRPSTKIVSQ